MNLPSKLFWTTVHLLLLPVTGLLLIALFVYKQFVCFLASHLEKLAGPVEGPTFFFSADHQRDRPAHAILAMMKLKGHFPPNHFVAKYQQQYDQRKATGERCYPELGYYPVMYLGHVFWKPVADFKISAINNPSNCDDISDAEPELAKLSTRLLRQPFGRDQPLWEVRLLYTRENSEKYTWHVFRFHHILGDGLSLQKFIYPVLDPETPVPNFTRPSKNPTHQSRGVAVLSKMGTLLTCATVGVVETLYEMLLKQDHNFLGFDNSGKIRATGEWVTTMGKRMDIKVLKTASHHYNCSIVHILLAGIGGGVEKFLGKISEHEKKKIPQNFELVVPLPIPNHPDGRLVNHWCLGKLQATTGLADIPTKMAYWKAETQRCVTCSIPMVTALIYKRLLSLIPGNYGALLQVFCTGTYSNMVGPERPGATILDGFFWLPIIQERLTFSAGTISCNGGIRVCLTGDLGCFGDTARVNELGDWIFKEIQAICEASGKGGLVELTE